MKHPGAGTTIITQRMVAHRGPSRAGGFCELVGETVESGARLLGTSVACIFRPNPTKVVELPFLLPYPRNQMGRLHILLAEKVRNAVCENAGRFAGA